MGIRMTLAVGYGLDLNQFGGADRKGLKFEHLKSHDAFERWKEDVVQFAEEHDEFTEKMHFHESFGPPKELWQMVNHQDEFGLKDKLLLTPAGHHESWHRYGDLLDAFTYEAQKGDEEIDMVPEWIEHPGTLYPYVDLMKVNPEKPLGVEKYWIPCYRNHPEHRDAIAWAPWHLWFLIKHLGLWPEERTTEAFLSLRPTIYRYWS